MNGANNYRATGALGQIGSEMVPEPKCYYGPDRVVDSDVRIPAAGYINSALDVLAPFAQRQKKMSGSA